MKGFQKYNTEDVSMKEITAKMNDQEKSILFEDKVEIFLKEKGLTVKNLFQKQGASDLFCEEIGCIECMMRRKGDSIDGISSTFFAVNDCSFKETSEATQRKTVDFLAQRYLSGLKAKDVQIQKHIQNNKQEIIHPRLVCLTFDVSDLPREYHHNDWHEDALLRALYGIDGAKCVIQNNTRFYCKENAKIIKLNKDGQPCPLESSFFSTNKTISAILFVYPVLLRKINGNDFENISIIMCDERIKDVKLQASDFLLFINPNAEKPLNQEQLSCFERMGIKFFNQEIGVFNFNYE